MLQQSTALASISSSSLPLITMCPLSLSCLLYSLQYRFLSRLLRDASKPSISSPRTKYLLSSKHCKRRRVSKSIRFVSFIRESSCTFLGVVCYSAMLFIFTHLQWRTSPVSILIVRTIRLWNHTTFKLEPLFIWYCSYEEGRAKNVDTFRCGSGNNK